ncbi:L-aspartate oxidase [Sedimentisphaera salicampi]|uniref:L-aspartate oxidase n=1 Tax=Sedimentisphaera salicampi TaxID=1941349 RepID=A0A1W6LLF3_9BACT|nr:L-aspartate oxidase [Sedimentisphaera salicampi]ARN56609.1 L-aspartate oxidase [Sedimentisphaera salicampi]
MKIPFFRRYLTNISTRTAKHLFTDVIVVGSGISGLRAALEAAKSCNVTVVSKRSLTKSNTWAAQGGIAAVMKEGDSPEKHTKDTLDAGCGLCREASVQKVVAETPELIDELHKWGTEFDLNDSGEIAATLEAGHSASRVAHAFGDSTGKAISQTLLKKASEHPRITLMEDFFTIDIVTGENGKCSGIYGLNSRNDLELIWANSVILATGGAGRLYRETTNPSVATGDGIAMAFRAGAELADMEFIQFHPTTLYVAGATRALVSEALRGEGGVLVDSNNSRFMFDYDERAELAPRDIVSRSIIKQIRKTNTTHVFLDVRHFEKGFFQRRFPYIFSFLKEFDIDPEKDLIPVRPSAHYMIGGIQTDQNAAASIPGLFACGECAATGLHGANRLASNSLAEGLVFGREAGRNAAGGLQENGSENEFSKIKYDIEVSDRSMLDTADIRNSLRALMWRNVGISRKEQTLRETIEIIQFWQRYVMDKVFDAAEGWECQNMLTTALLMANSALERKESRGVHFREDFPEPAENFEKHISVSSDDLLE